MWSESAYRQSVHQLVTGLADGSYTISAWVKATVYGEKPKSVQMEMTGFGGADVFKSISPTSKYQKISSTVKVTNGQLDIGFYVDSPGLTSLQIDQVTILRN